MSEVSHTIASNLLSTSAPPASVTTGCDKINAHIHCRFIHRRLKEGLERLRLSNGASGARRADAATKTASVTATAMATAAMIVNVEAVIKFTVTGIGIELVSAVEARQAGVTDPAAVNVISVLSGW